MHIGFFAASLPNVSLDKLVPWAAGNGFSALEMGCWPVEHNGRDYTGSTINTTELTREKASEIKKLFSDNNMKISSLGYYEDYLSPKEGEKQKRINHFKKVIDAAALLEVDLAGTFIGGNPMLTPDNNMKEAGRLLRDFMKYANKRNVRLMLENCPMTNWQKKGLPGNYAYSPELWDRLFNEVDDDNFGLNIDPSHLYWLNIDHILVLEEYADKIFHVHAKDTEMLAEGEYRYGIYSRQLKESDEPQGWWRYRIPGLGEIDWGEYISTLYEIGYDSVLSIEHEDPIWEGTEEKVKKGLIYGRKHLSNYLL